MKMHNIHDIISIGIQYWYTILMTCKKILVLQPAANNKLDPPPSKTWPSLCLGALLFDIDAWSQIGKHQF